jgi:hypothetical protein
MNFSSWPDLGERWPFRLVATAEEDRLNILAHFLRARETTFSRSLRALLL